MKHHEFYVKHKTNYSGFVNSFSIKRSWWLILLITLLAVLIEPLVLMYKHQRSGPFSMGNYLELAGYLLLMVIPFIAFLYWINWRESTKRSLGFSWIGKFEVIDKSTSLIFNYLLLDPGVNNKVKVSRELFRKIRVGDFIRIRKDAFGKIEEIRKVSNFYEKLARAKVKR